MLKFVGFMAAPGLALLLASGLAHAYPTDFCYERSHFALMAAQDRDKFFNKQSDQGEDYAKKTWAYILRDHSKREIDEHTDIIATVWEVMQGQTPDAIETIVLQDCLKRPERYR
ncbi:MULTISPECIES: hypothetical protein [Paraburkholderia]|uniref:Uncharacterized protein n=1 Tax=Paraburkholderia madseniana TaxID=2599607 RepID=A0AAP5BLI1_9BURK|nr:MULTISPECIES: hypothetical protein [Paraburkholderia]MCX4151997.1 hypothetical protein [Paraburkholderia madseniana]MCX4176909.1 hypothetical protein [Paraburkholderia madseniana]MDN7154925.1 hypothetical protein [Paraburkholderia sp. WS6]MDQ6413808.1 hypothetical protein [Paraburkholderia madseniana]MDQ6464900.1 hypothetical protein [Paraburkholderia madseniana]